MPAEIRVEDGRVACLLCAASGGEHRTHVLGPHLADSHDTTVADYLGAHEGAATVSQAALDAYNARGRLAAPAPEDLSVTLMGLSLKVDAAVAEEECLMLPNGYAFPTVGKAKGVFGRALKALARGRNAFIWGMPGTGKDALVHAFSAYTRKPVVMVTFRPGTDLAPWFYTRSIDKEGTGWEYGELWRALTEGIKGRDGVARPVLVLLSDVDRADSAQAEWFRILTDSISGRILGPDGKMVKIMEGTQFACTANSCGTGDLRGRMASANPMDASILDRFGRKIEAVYMDWEDEGAILRAKYPTLAQTCPQIFGTKTHPLGELGAATKSLRESIDAEDLYAEFTHRSLCAVLDECEDELHFLPEGQAIPDNLLKRGFRAWLDGLDADNRLVARRLVDAHVKGGAIDDED